MADKTAKKRPAWTTADSAELYRVDQWGHPYFSINPKTGRMEVHPEGPKGPHLDLKELVEQLQRRGIAMPILLRFNGIMRSRISRLCEAFSSAIGELGYKGAYRGVYPIKVNQQRQILEEIVSHGRQYHFGLEAGSKPELMAVLSILEDREAPVICNGYKDEEFLEMALLATKMGREIIPVVEQFDELETIIRLSKELGVRPKLGVRLKLATRGAGRWEQSGGDKSKFGLSITHVLEALDMLRDAGMLDCLVLTHFHLGSQITTIRTIRQAIQEAARIFVELQKLGCTLQYMDVGGGLAIDYDGSRSTGDSSSNYDLEEYAETIIDQIMRVCDAAEVSHPTVITESGRAIAAHHSVLVFNVLGTAGVADDTQEIPTVSKDDPNLLQSMASILTWMDKAHLQAAIHEADYWRQEALTAFRVGVLTLTQRATAERLYWQIYNRCLALVRHMDFVPEEFHTLEQRLAEIYYCNFSIFQSIPDAWAIDQQFPILPLHRHTEEPSKRGILVDLTCDSDGKLENFIGSRGRKSVLELHPFDGTNYYVGAFLVGAYQEILGDLHNLFGDTNAVHVEVGGPGGYRLSHVVKGDTVTEVLNFVQFSAEDMLHRLRLSVEEAVAEGRLTFEESAHLLSRYEEGLDGYTYME